MAQSETDSDPILSWALVALAAAIACYTVSGPLMLGTIELHTSPAALEQVKGGDLAALIAVVPVCLAAAATARRDHRTAALIAFGPSLFAIYTYSQIFLGNDYALWPGNVEYFFGIFVLIIWLAVIVAWRAWSTLDAGTLVLSDRRRRDLGYLLLVIAGFVVIGIHARSYADVLTATPSRSYLDAPTAFWVVKMWDLAVVAPAALAAGIGLLRRRTSASKPALALLGAFVLLGCSVFAMALRMYVVGVPDASLAMVIASAVITVVGGRFSFVVYRSALAHEEGRDLRPSRSGHREVV
jgi:hypothetical protein